MNRPLSRLLRLAVRPKNLTTRIIKPPRGLLHLALDPFSRTGLPATIVSSFRRSRADLPSHAGAMQRRFFTTTGTITSALGTFQVAATADNFSQGRVANVIRRLKEQSARENDQQVVVSRLTLPPEDPMVPLLFITSPPTAPQLVEVNTTMEKTVWKCCTLYSVYVPSIPMAAATTAPYSLLEFSAVGFSADERLATLAAAMHAERLLDHSGVHMFALPRMQDNHARTARSHGRWAPLSGEGRHSVPENVSACPPVAVLIPCAPAATTPKAKRLDPFGHRSSAPRLHHQGAAVAPTRAFGKQRAHQYDATFRRAPLLPSRRPAAWPPNAADDRMESCKIFRNTDDWKENAAEQRGGGANNAQSSGIEIFDAFHKYQQTAAPLLIDAQDVVIVASEDDGATGVEDPQHGATTGHPPVVPPTAKHRQFTSPVALLPSDRRSTLQTTGGGRFDYVEDDDRFDLDGFPNLLCIRDPVAQQRLREAACATYRVVMGLERAQRTVEADPVDTPNFPTPLDVQLGVAINRLPLPSSLTVGTSVATCDDHDGFEATWVVPVLFFAMSFAVQYCPALRDIWARLEDEERARCIAQWAEHIPIVLEAKGRAPTSDLAKELCAMHAERLLEQVGVPLFAGCDGLRDLALNDACLRYGRARSPPVLTQYELCTVLPNVITSAMHKQSALSSADASAAPTELVRQCSTALAALIQKRVDRLGTQLQRPLKSYPRRNDPTGGSKANKRDKQVPLSAHELLLHLNRMIINSQRIHVLELDLDDRSEWLMDAEEDLRHYLREQSLHRSGHMLGAELCYVNFVYTPHKQYRCSVFLPLPKPFGIRGGYAIGASSVTARRLCALHALDVLCAIGVPVYKNPERQAAFLAKRAERGLLLPPPTPMHDVRSPPGYREVPGGAVSTVPSAAIVWRLMMTDASEFDVIRSVEEFYTTASLPVAQKPPSPYGKRDEMTVLRELAYGTLTHIGIDAKERIGRVGLLASDQHLGKRRRLPANNMWLAISSTKILAAVASSSACSADGRRDLPDEIVAWGRCFHRKGAERAMLVHLIRLFVALGVDVTGGCHHGKAHLDAFMAVHGRPEDMRRGDQPSATNRGDFDSGAGDVRVALPCPVMSHELAVKTFV